MKHAVAATLTMTMIAAVSCDADEPKPDPAEPEATTTMTPDPVDEVDEIDEVEAEVPELLSVVQLDRKMELWSDAPDEIDPGPNAVVLRYVNFPGHYEIFDEALVKECILAAEEKPFDVTFFRYIFASDDRFERAVTIEPCPDLTAKKLAAQWVEAELLRDAVEEPKQADPDTNIAGWAGRGFYKIDDADPNETPFDEEWKTFCGEKSGTPCNDALGGS